MYMKNAKNTAAKNTAAKNETATVEKIMTVADVARELKIDPKRARAFLRKNADKYAPFRNKTFTPTSALYKQCVDLLTAYKNKTAPVTK